MPGINSAFRENGVAQDQETGDLRSKQGGDCKVSMGDQRKETLTLIPE